MKSSNARFRGITLLNAWHYENVRDAHPIPLRVRPGYMLIELMTGGRGWVQDGQDWREVLPGDLIWNGPGDFSIGRSDFKNPYRCLALTLAGASPLPLPRFSRWSEIGEVRHFMEEVVQLFRRETFDRSALCDYVLSQLRFRIRVHAHQIKTEHLPVSLRRVLAVIDRDFGKPCRIAELARVAEWSEAHLHEVFQMHLNVSPHQWLIRRRLQAAREKLESSLQPIKQIAAECGFSDAAALAHSFKFGVGMTPLQYRKRYLRAGASE